MQWIIENSYIQAISSVQHPFLTIVADSSVLVSVSLTHNSFSIIKSESHSHLPKSNNNFIRCYVPIAISINVIEDLKMDIVLLAICYHY